MRRGEHDARGGRIAREGRPGCPHADRRMRIEQIAGFALRHADLVGDFRLGHRLGGEFRADARERAIGNGEGARLRQLPHQPPDRGAVAVIGLEEQPLEIRGDLDIHRGRGGRHHAPDGVFAGCQCARQDVVGVARDLEIGHRQAHRLGDMAGEDIAEIARRHGEGDGPVRAAKRHGGGEVIHRLRRDAGPDRKSVV